jgi:hypothetical protein
MIKRSLPKMVSSTAAWLSPQSPAPTQKRATDWPAVFPPSSDTGAAADSPGGLPRAREPGDLHAPGDRFPGRSVILGMIGAVIRPESSPGNPA